MKQQTTAVALSGGIDSLVAACLLKESGHTVFGIHFVSGYESWPPPPAIEQQASSGPGGNCCRLPENHPLSTIKNMLGFEVWAVDCRSAFKREVVDYFIRSYLKGMTPNPCMVCNQRIKFGVLLQAALDLGAERLATGHYALPEEQPGKGYVLKKGKDKDKEQSYFLAMLNSSQLEKACFPLGSMTKEQVLGKAAERGLRPASARESQDICFVKQGHYIDFLAGHAGILQEPGEIVDTKGRVIGRHQGLHRYTIGQRRGINCPAEEPYYVVRLDAAGNRLVVGFKNELYSFSCRIQGTRWPAGRPDKPLRVHTKIRYRHQPAESEIFPEEKDRAVIKFSHPQPAVTPGQAAVCYQDERIVAGGWIYE